MKIVKISGNDCGGFKAPKGHLDTQMYPECEGYETDRNIVKKTQERRKKKKTVAENENETIIAKHLYPIVRDNKTKGIWEQWKDREIDDRKFVDLIKHVVDMGFAGVSKDPTVRKGIMSAINNFNKYRDYAEAARAIGAFLSMGDRVAEEHFADSSSWYKRAQMDYPELRGDFYPEKRERLNLDHSLKEEIINMYKKEFPNITATLEEMWDWYRRHFTKIPKKFDWEKQGRPRRI